MGKETVQNVLALRFANAIFEPIWNRRYVDHMQITVAEQLGVEHRGRLLREGRGDARHRAEPRHAGAGAHAHGAARQHGRPGHPGRESQAAARGRDPRRRRRGHPGRARPVRGRASSTAAGARVPRGGRGRPAEPDRDVRSHAAPVDNWRWAGVPIYVRTGKRLPSPPPRWRCSSSACRTSPSGASSPGPAPQHAAAANPARRGDLPLLRREGAGRGVPAAHGGHGLQLRRRLPRRRGRTVRATAARRDDRRPTLFIRTDEVERPGRSWTPSSRRGARTACPCRSTPRARGAPRSPMCSSRATCASGTSRDRAGHGRRVGG